MTQNAFHPKPSRKHGDQAALNNLSLGEEALNNQLEPLITILHLDILSTMDSVQITY